MMGFCLYRTFICKDHFVKAFSKVLLGKEKPLFFVNTTDKLTVGTSSKSPPECNSAAEDTSEGDCVPFVVQ